MDRGPRGSRTVRWGALTFDYHLVHRFDWRKSQTAGVPAPGPEKDKPPSKDLQLDATMLSRRSQWCDFSNDHLVTNPALLHSAFHFPIPILFPMRFISYHHTDILIGIPRSEQFQGIRKGHKMIKETPSIYVLRSMAYKYFHKNSHHALWRKGWNLT